MRYEIDHCLFCCAILHSSSLSFILHASAHFCTATVEAIEAEKGMIRVFATGRDLWCLGGNSKVLCVGVFSFQLAQAEMNQRHWFIPLTCNIHFWLQGDDYLEYFREILGVGGFGHFCLFVCFHKICSRFLYNSMLWYVVLSWSP